MTLLRTQLGNSLRSHRLRQSRTLRDVSGAARVSLGYLSEVERGQKEASSELLASICDALELEIADLLAEVSDSLRTGSAPSLEARPGRTTDAERPGTDRPTAEPVPAGSATPATAPEPALALVGAPPSGGPAARPALRRGAVSLAA